MKNYKVDSDTVSGLFIDWFYNDVMASVEVYEYDGFPELVSLFLEDYIFADEDMRGNIQTDETREWVEKHLEELECLQCEGTGVCEYRDGVDTVTEYACTLCEGDGDVKRWVLIEEDL